MTERITITLDKNLLQKIDSRIDHVKIRNRSHAIELLLSETLNSQKLRKAIVLGGGKGTRLRPFTYEIPKPLIPLKGKPIIGHILTHLASCGISNAILSLGYMSEKIISSLGTGKEYGINIEYSVEKQELGTAGPLKLAKEFLNEAFLMQNGDILSKIDVQDMYNFHKNSGGIATIALIAVEDPSRFGVVELKGNKLISFVEKPKKDAASNLVSAGIYILEPEVIDYIPEGYSMVEKELFPKIASEGKLNGYIYTGPWFDIGTTESYEKAIKGWKY